METEMAPSLHGRAAALTAIDAAIAQAALGRGELLLVSGESGLGKTALAEAAATRAGAAGLLPCWGRAWEEGAPPPLWPWIQALRTAVAHAPADWIPDRWGAHEREILRQLLPELRSQGGSEADPDTLSLRLPGLRGATRTGDTRGNGNRPGADDFALFDALRLALLDLGRAVTPFLILEDLHAADLRSLQLLRLMAQEVRSLPVLILATYRPLAARRHDAVDRLLTGCARDGRQLALQALDVEDTQRLLADRRPEIAGAALGRRVHELTSGNPRLVELLAAGMPTGQDPRAPLPIPESLRSAVRHQQETLDPDARALTAAAAVLGPEIDVVRLRPLLAEVDRDALLELLGTCVSLGVLVEVHDRPGRYRFRHEIVRQAIEADLPPAERSRLHLAAAAIIEDLHARDLEPHLEKLAGHYVAGSPDDVRRALEVAVLAAERAVEVVELDRAVDLWRGAVILAERSGAERLERCDLLLRLGDAEARAGMNAAARTTFIEAARGARGSGDPHRFARAALGCGGRATTPTAGVIDGALVDLLREALEQLHGLPDDPEVDATRAALMGRLAMERYYVDPREVRDTVTAEAVALAHRSGDRGALGRALNARHYALWSLDVVEERLANATEILEVAREANDPELALQARTWRIVASLELGDGPAVDREIAIHARLAQAIAQPYHQWNALVIRGMRALLEGRFTDARQHAEAALELGASQDVLDQGTSMGPNARMLYGVQLFNLHREQGRLAELDETITSFSRSYPNLPVWRCALALTRLQQGRVAEAREEVEHLSAHDFGSLPTDGNWLIAMTLLADVAVELGDAQRAAALRTLLAPYAQRVVVVAQGASCRGSVAHYLGRLSATLGEHAVAVDHLRRAVSVHDALGARPYALRSRLALADSLEALDGDAEEVRGLRADAGSEAADLDLPIGGDVAAQPTGDPRTPVLVGAVARSRCGGGATAAEVAATGGDRRRAGASRTPGRPEPAARLVRDGSRWTVTFEGRTSQLRDAKGLRYLAHLLAEPDVDHPAVLLERGGSSGVVDRTAARGRFDELRADLREVELTGDVDRAADIREQMSALADHLTGSDAAADGRAEQARVNVTRAIRTALRNVTAADTGLAEHLGQALRTGASCTYRPDPRAPITWLVDRGDDG